MWVNVAPVFQIKLRSQTLRQKVSTLNAAFLELQPDSATLDKFSHPKPSDLYVARFARYVLCADQLLVWFMSFCASASLS